MSLLEPNVETQVVFTSPDPGEAAAVRRRLEEEGCDAGMLHGPDPVTGTGGGLFGGASASFFNVTVPLAQVEKAGRLLAAWAGPSLLPEECEGPIEEAPPGATRLRHVATLLLAVIYGGVLLLATFLAIVYAENEVFLAQIVLYLLVGGVVLLAVRYARRGTSNPLPTDSDVTGCDRKG